MRIYLSGPISGVENGNQEAFNDAAEALRKHGHGVLSPIELDETDGVDPAAPHDPEEYAQLLARDILLIAERGIEAVALLDGWEHSKGARAEVEFARACGLDLYTLDAEYNLMPWEGITGGELRAETLHGGAIKITSKTGGSKGRKRERFELLPWHVLDQVARVYAMGAEKYEDFNYLKGYDWSLSSGAMLRHIAAWMSGEDRDEESGEHHLAHACWHTLALLMFEKYDLGTDDRWKPEKCCGEPDKDFNSEWVCCKS